MSNKLILYLCLFIQYLFDKILLIKSDISTKQIFPNEKTLYFIWNIKVKDEYITSVLDKNNSMAWYTSSINARKACVIYLIKNYLW